MSSPWDPDFGARSPMFEPLHAVVARLACRDWPDFTDYNRALSARSDVIRCASGKPLVFVAQTARPRGFSEKYEPRIYERGEVQTRGRNWHDALNAMVWLTFPRIKAALNRRHYDALVDDEEHGATGRGPVRDALTLFDEGGVIVLSASRELGELLVAHEWIELFWRRRAEVLAHMRFILFGHALYEKALQPYVGVTGRGLVCRVEKSILDLPLVQQLAALDAMLATQLEDPMVLAATRDLAAVPVLGVPGWCADNECAGYYENPDYFRPASSPVASALSPQTDVQLRPRFLLL